MIPEAFEQDFMNEILNEMYNVDEEEEQIKINNQFSEKLKRIRDHYETYQENKDIEEQIFAIISSALEEIEFVIEKETML